jgi:hypothetical protein
MIHTNNCWVREWNFINLTFAPDKVKLMNSCGLASIIVRVRDSTFTVKSNTTA